MSLLDGSYISRLRLHNLDQIYEPGSVVPGSAFQDTEQVVEYIRRGWVDVDSSGPVGASFHTGESVWIQGTAPSTSAGSTWFGNANRTLLTWFTEETAAGDDTTIANFDEAPWDWISDGSVFCRLQPGLYQIRLRLTGSNLPRWVAQEFSGSVNPALSWLTQRPYHPVNGLHETVVRPVYLADTDLYMGVSQVQDASFANVNGVSLDYAISITPLVL